MLMLTKSYQVSCTIKSQVSPLALFLMNNQVGSVMGAGSIDQSHMKNFVTTIMGGSAEAFRLRRKRYAF